MKIYTVGGAVRDMKRGVEPQDRDYVVVGSTPAEMLAMGYRQVGADFPVFLHPETGDEYALARTERKVGSGYKGFATEYSPDVTLEDDLIRRDFTINAMAMDEDGQLIDPFGGVRDLDAGVLRATSSAFEEDPLRVLRLARFVARLGFSVDPSTAEMARRIAMTDDFRDLTPGRINIELMKVLGTDRPDLFFSTLLDLEALHVHFPEIAALVGQTQPAAHHPEGDAFVHSMLVLRQAVEHGFGPVERFAALVHDLGKGLTPKDLLPAHHDHEEAGVPLVDALCDRLRISNEMRKPALIATQYHAHVHRIDIMNPRSISRLLGTIEADHTRYFAEVLANVSMCDAKGRGPDHASRPYPERDRFLQLSDAFASVKLRTLVPVDDIRSMSIEHRKNKLASGRVARIKQEQKRIAEEMGADLGVEIGPAL